MPLQIDPLTAAGVTFATAATDAVYVLFTYAGFAAAGSWIGAYLSLTYLHRPVVGAPPQ